MIIIFIEWLKVWFMRKKGQKKLDKNFLIERGMKEALFNKLTDKQIEGLLAFSMDHMRATNLSLMLIQLASMELGNKKGAIMLAVDGVITPIQLKNLSAEQVKIVVEDYALHEDPKIAIKTIKKMLVLSQQEKMYNHTDGIKGEYFVDPKDFEDEDYA